MPVNLEYTLHQIESEIQIDPKTGKGKASIRATARLADISDYSLRLAFSTIAQPNRSRLAQYLIQQGFEAEILAQLAETGIPDIIVGAIIEYYALEAGRYCNDQAKQVFRVFARIGIRAWMQDITGYQKQDTQQINVAEFLEKQLPYTPKQWECRFKPEFWAALENLYGLRRGQFACAKFISHWVYGYFPQEVRDRINEINPLDDCHYRKNLIHQHFDDKLLKALSMQISIVTSNLIRSKTRHHFKRLMKNARRYSFTTKNLPLLGK